MVGLTQVLDPRTTFTVNYTVGNSDGYLTDPYKLVELNGALVGEKRPGTRDKNILYLSLSHFFPDLKGSLEGGFRSYTDSFGIDSQTLTLSWYQKMGLYHILRPQLRYYDQSAADFYGVRFKGSPEFYSSDYRLSDLTSLGAGLKLIYTPNARFQYDLEYMRYMQSGNDGVTADDAYPSASVFTVGMRIWL